MGIYLTKADLADSGKFHTLPKPLACFKPHVRSVLLPGQSKPVEIRVEAGDIYEIAQKAGDLQAQGIYPRITDGHINGLAHTPESAQPALIGFASDPQVILEQGEPRLAYTWHIKPEYLPLLKHRPHRSAEFFPASKEIRGIAALLRDPALDLGTLYYDRGGELVYLTGVDNMTEDPTNPMEPTNMSEAEAAMFEKFCRYLAEKYPVLAATAQTPPVAESVEDIPALYQQQVDVLTQQVKQLADQRDHEQCVAMVSQLIAERYQLDPSVEIEELKKRSVEERRVRVDYIRQYYQQLPGGTPIPTLAGAVPYHLLPQANPNHHGTLTKAQSETALKYQAEHHCTWETAKRAVAK